MDKYRDIEEKYKNNLDNWLCNLYFSIKSKKMEDMTKELSAKEEQASSKSHSKHGSPNGRNPEVQSDDEIAKEDTDKLLVPKTAEGDNLTRGGPEALNHADEKVEDATPDSELKEKSKVGPKRKGLYTPNEFDEYTFNIHHIDLKSDAVVTRKFYYVVNEALSDLGFNSLRSLNFWISLLILVAVLWIRAYIHTFGSWVLLKMSGTAVNVFTPKLYLCCQP